MTSRWTSLVAQRWSIRLQCRRRGFDPWVEKIPWGGNGYPLQCSCLGNPMDRGAWWATSIVTKSRTRLRNRTHTHTTWPASWQRAWSFLPCLPRLPTIQWSVNTHLSHAREAKQLRSLFCPPKTEERDRHTDTSLHTYPLNCSPWTSEPSLLRLCG